MKLSKICIIFQFFFCMVRSRRLARIILSAPYKFWRVHRKCIGLFFRCIIIHNTSVHTYKQCTGVFQINDATSKIYSFH
jgi:hypothetical protein